MSLLPDGYTEANGDEIDFNKLADESDEHIFIYVNEKDGMMRLISSNDNNPTYIIAFLMHKDEHFRNQVEQNIRSMQEMDNQLN